MVLTVKGKGAARAAAEEGIRQGLEDAKHGRVRPAREFFDDFEPETAIPGSHVA